MIERIRRLVKDLYEFGTCQTLLRPASSGQCAGCSRRVAKRLPLSRSRRHKN